MVQVIVNGQPTEVTEHDYREIINLLLFKERLTKRGYSVTLNALVMSDSSNENAFMNMLENDKYQISIKRYSFDVRA